MKLSFIVSAYERPKALRTCLSSLVQQSMEDFEIIVVDNSREQMAHNGMLNMDSRISYVYTGDMTHIGGAIHKRCLYIASEIGVAHSIGEWLCFPNDDSYYVPWFTERMLAHAERENLQLVYCDLVMGGPREHHPMICWPRLCCIDKTNWMVRRECWQGWTGASGESYPQADGLTIEAMVKRGLRHGRLEETLCVHN